MDLDLAGKTAVVTGATKGIGLAVTTALVAEGVRVVAGSRSSSAELDALGDAVRFFPVDLSTAAGPAALVAEAGGALDILVNNVGALTPRTTGFLNVTDDDWLATLNLDLMAVVRTTRAAIPLLIERGGGTVVTIWLSGPEAVSERPLRARPAPGRSSGRATPATRVGQRTTSAT